MASASLSHGDTPRPSHHSKTFDQLVAKTACSCGRPECREVLRDYYLDPASPYPDPDNPQLMFVLGNPAANPDPRRWLFIFNSSTIARRRS